MECLTALCAQCRAVKNTRNMAKIKIQKTDINTVDASQVNEIGNKTWFLERIAGATDSHPRWDSNATKFGVDAFNFNALPAGSRVELHESIGIISLFMTSTIQYGTQYRALVLTESSDIAAFYATGKNVGGSVRSFRLATTAELTFSDGTIIQNVLTDGDSNVYSGVKIGTQIWIRENYACTKLANGDAIPTGFDDNDWASLATKGYSTPQESGYGLLYNYYALTGLIGGGFSVPTSSDFTTLTNYIESLLIWDNTNVGKALKSISQVGSTYISDKLKPILPYLLDANYFVNLPAPTKAQIESQLTGDITTHTHTPYPQTDLATASGTITMPANTVTNLTDTSTGTFTIAFGSATANKANDYGFVLRIGGTLRTVNWDAGIVWKDGTAPTLAINKTYYFVSSKLGAQYLTAFNTF